MTWTWRSSPLPVLLERGQMTTSQWYDTCIMHDYILYVCPTHQTASNLGCMSLCVCASMCTVYMYTTTFVPTTWFLITYSCIQIISVCPCLYQHVDMQLLDHVGVVEELLQDGDLYVRYPNNSLLPVSPQGANKVSIVSQMKVIVTSTC